MQLAQRNKELAHRGMDTCSHEVIRLQRFLAEKEEEIQDLKDNMEKLQAMQVVTAARSLDFELRCDIIEYDKEKLLKKSIHKDKTIKRLQKELKNAITSYHKSLKTYGT